MKSKLYITIILIALLFLGAVHVASAQDIVAGVAPGDQFTYSVTGSYPVDDPNAQVPQEVIDASQTVYFKVDIINVTGPEIGYNWNWHFANGTHLNDTGTVNVETTLYVGPFWTIVPANLTTGERIHPHFGPDQSVFNETVRYLYTNYTRDTNRLQLDFAYQNNITQAIKYEQTDTYFDKLTGMLVQLTDKVDYQNPTFTTEVVWKLSGQNVWTYASAGSYPLEPFFSLPVIIAITVGVAVVVVIAGWFVSNKRRDARRRKLLKKS
jgi:hypothetical protein